MLIKHCSIHNAQMEQKFSKDKKDQDGNPWGYFAHQNGPKLCFGTKEDGAEQPKEVAETVPAGQQALPATQMSVDDSVEGRVRHGVTIASIQNMGLVELTPELKQLINENVAFILTGK